MSEKTCTEVRDAALEEAARALEAERGKPDLHGRWSQRAYTAALTNGARIIRNLKATP